MKVYRMPRILILELVLNSLCINWIRLNLGIGLDIGCPINKVIWSEAVVVSKPGVS